MNEFPSPKQFLWAALTFVFLAASLSLNAQTQSSLVTPRVTETVNETSLVTLKGTVNPLANAQNDAGPAPADTQVQRIQLMLKRSPQQESTLQELIANMHTPGSAGYHKWLTPTQFGQQFGPADQDIQTIQAWVQSHGFEVGALHPGKGVLEISGTIGQVQEAFHTSIHRYSVGGQLHYANATDPQIPSALAPVLGGFVSLNNFPVHRMGRTLGKAIYDPQTDHATPQWTNPDTGSQLGFDLVVSPADFDVQYDLSPLYSAGTNGTGQTVAIINDSNININVVNNFRTLFGLSANPPQVIIDGNDPGIDGINNPAGPNLDSIEAYLDVEWSGAVAPNATIDLVIGADTALESGLILAAEHAISNNLAPVMSVSFGACEQSLGSNNQFINSLWEQAAAQGITVLVASGDSGSAGTDPQGAVCDTPNSTAAQFGLAVSGYASTPYNVAVGGTDFFYSQYQSATLPTQLGTYWNLTQSATPKASLTTVIPEQPWNDSAFGLNFLTSSAATIAGGGGGASSCSTGTTSSQTGAYTVCSGGYAKPAWQTGTGVPNDKVRDIPDVSLFAADGLNDSFYPICAADGDCQSGASTPQITGVGGTSASSPAMAGIMALVVQKYGAQGQADFVLYPLAKQHPSAFHDVTNGTNAEPCNIGSANCVAGGTVQGKGELSGYGAGTGYDLATGLGSVDANQLVSNWNSVHFTTTTTTLTPSPTSFTHGAAVNFTTSVTGQGGTPTGNVALVTDSSGVNQQGQTVFPLTNGSGSGSVSFLPGGTYHVWGQYGGDGTFGASTSSKTQITVNPESSSLIFNVVSPTSGGLQPIGSGTNAVNQVPYGTQIVLDGEVVPTTYYNQCNGGNSTSTTCKNFVLPAATGNVAFKDGSNTLSTAVINAEGDAEFTTGGFALGTHSVTASYPGDASYNSSNATAVSFTVVKGTVTVKVTPSLSPVAQGQTLVLSALVDGGSTGSAAPTGTVQFANGTTLLGQATKLSPTADASTGAVAGIGTLTLSNLALAPGAQTITAVYSGDSNYSTGSGSV
ncbi:MAG TPA: Ig-like domain repeat protein, partial [Acidobacteriaceae bacterium]